jgi:hypothetical protein
VAGCCECGDETSVSGATELVNSLVVGYQLFVGTYRFHIHCKLIISISMSVVGAQGYPYTETIF